mgnify:CR=1 FL=1
MKKKEIRAWLFKLINKPEYPEYFTTEKFPSLKSKIVIYSYRKLNENEAKELLRKYLQDALEHPELYNVVPSEGKIRKLMDNLEKIEIEIKD